jgi:o-succinylbenzoate---CoA ligase
MQVPHYKSIHNRFKINGFTLEREEIFQLAFTLIREGDDFEIEAGIFLMDWFDDHSYVDTLTSGTTGTPKMIRISKQAMVHSAIATGDFLGLRPGNTALHCLPCRFIAGKMMLVRAIILGLEMDLVSPKGNPIPNKHKVYDFSAMVPLQVEHALLQLNQIKKLIVGGAKIAPSLVNQLQNCDTEVYETYGMTETITHIAAKKIEEVFFQTLPNVKVSVDDRSCLVIDAPNILEEKIVTNDIVNLVSSTSFQWLGRYDNVINSGGVKLFPERIEEKLQDTFSVPFFIASEYDEHLGEKVILVVESKEFPLSATIFDVLEKYEKPKKVYFIPNFIRTETGKVNRLLTLKNKEAF